MYDLYPMSDAPYDICTQVPLPHAFETDSLLKHRLNLTFENALETSELVTEAVNWMMEKDIVFWMRTDRGTSLTSDNEHALAVAQTMAEDTGYMVLTEHRLDVNLYSIIPVSHDRCKKLLSFLTRSCDVDIEGYMVVGKRDDLEKVAARVVKFVTNLYQGKKINPWQ